MVQLCAAIWHQCLTTSIIRFPISPQDWSLQATNLHKYSQKPHAKYCFGDKRHYTVALWILFQHYLCNTCTLVTAYVRSSRPTSHTYRDFSAKHTKKTSKCLKTQDYIRQDSVHVPVCNLIAMTMTHTTVISSIPLKIIITAQHSPGCPAKGL